jgi:hypothetical protein
VFVYVWSQGSRFSALDPVARSRQVCIYVVEALLIALFYLGNEVILVDIRTFSRVPVSSDI